MLKFPRAAVSIGVAALALTACSSNDDSSAPEEPAPPNPGLAFNGTYEVTWLTHKGEPVDPNTDPAYITARTDCPDADVPCRTAMEFSIPTGGQPPTQYVLDYRDGTWTGAQQETFRCTTEDRDYGDQTNWTAITIAPDPAAPDLLGMSLDYYQTSPCNQILTNTMSLKRTGDINPTIALTPADQIETAVDHSASPKLSGTYDFVFTPESESTQGSNAVYRMTTLCPRDQPNCIAIGVLGDAIGRTGLVLQAESGRWIGDYRRENLSCTSDPDSPRRNSRIARTDLGPAAGNPANLDTLTGFQEATETGDCPRVARWSVVATKTGE